MRVFTNIADVPARVWDEAAGGALGFDRALLQVTESPEHFRPAYIVHRDEDGSTVLATGIEFRDARKGSPVSDLILGRIQRRVPALKRAFGRTLVLRTRLAYRSGILMGSADSTNERVRFDRFLDDLETYAEDEGLGLFVMDVGCEEAELAAALTGRGFLATTGRPVARLAIEWTDWNDYVRAARQQSVNSASAIRREVNRFRRNDIEVTEWDRRRIPDRALWELYDAHHRRLNTFGLRYRRDFFDALKRGLGDRSRVLVALRDDVLVGSSFIIAGKDEAAVPLVGIDHAADRGACTYFNLSFYEPIRMAIREGWRVLTMGTGAHGAKIRRGCAIDAVRAYWRPAKAVTRIVSRPMVAAHRTALARKGRAAVTARPFSLLGNH